MFSSVRTAGFCCPRRSMELRGFGMRRRERRSPFCEVGATIRNARFSPDGKLVLTGSNDGTARLWRTDGSEFRRLAVPNSRISAAAFSPDGRLVATGSFDGTARLWSIEDGKLIATLKGQLRCSRTSRSARMDSRSSRPPAMERLEFGASRMVPSWLC